jgi:hypothetical protein
MIGFKYTEMSLFIYMHKCIPSRLRFCSVPESPDCLTSKSHSCGEEYKARIERTVISSKWEIILEFSVTGNSSSSFLSFLTSIFCGIFRKYLVLLSVPADDDCCKAEAVESSTTVD